MRISKEHLDLRVMRDTYDENEPNRQRLSTVSLTHIPTGVSVKARHLSQAQAYIIALGKLETLLHQ